MCVFKNVFDWKQIKRLYLGKFWSLNFSYLTEPQKQNKEWLYTKETTSLLRSKTLQDRKNMMSDLLCTVHVMRNKEVPTFIKSMYIL